MQPIQQQQVLPPPGMMFPPHIPGGGGGGGQGPPFNIQWAPLGPQQQPPPPRRSHRLCSNLVLVANRARSSWTPTASSWRTHADSNVLPFWQKALGTVPAAVPSHTMTPLRCSVTIDAAIVCTDRSTPSTHWDRQQLRQGSLCWFIWDEFT